MEKQEIQQVQQTQGVIEQPVKKSKMQIWIIVSIVLITGGIIAWFLLSGGDTGSIIPGGSSIPHPPSLPR